MVRSHRKPRKPSQGKPVLARVKKRGRLKGGGYDSAINDMEKTFKTAYVPGGGRLRAIAPKFRRMLIVANEKAKGEERRNSKRGDQ